MDRCVCTDKYYIRQHSLAIPGCKALVHTCSTMEISTILKINIHQSESGVYWCVSVSVCVYFPTLPSHLLSVLLPRTLTSIHTLVRAEAKEKEISHTQMRWEREKKKLKLKSIYLERCSLNTSQNLIGFGSTMHGVYKIPHLRHAVFTGTPGEGLAGGRGGWPVGGGVGGGSNKWLLLHSEGVYSAHISYKFENWNESRLDKSVCVGGEINPFQWI